MVLRKQNSLKTGCRNLDLREGAKRPDLPKFSRQKREQILQAATESFLELGYEGTSMNLVAERAGVIKQTIYSHFADKEALFVAVVSAVTVDKVKHIFAADAVKEPTPEMVVRRLAELLIAEHKDPLFANLMRTIIGESGRFPIVAELFMRATAKPGLALFSEYLRDHPDVHCPDPDAFARVFIGTLVYHSLQQNVLHGKTHLPFASSRIINELVRVFRLSCLEIR